MPRVAPALSFAAIAWFGPFLAGCGGGVSSASGCGTHQYSYVGGGLTVVGGAPWYGGDIGGGWYDPGDDGSDYADENASASGGSNGDDGNANTYGSGDDGSGDDNSGSNDDGSGDDGSGDDGSGDDGTASKKSLHTASVPLHTQSGVSSVNACYAYACDLLCAVGSPAIAEREARGYSSINADDACATAAHGVETWAHDNYGTDVSACRLAGSDLPTASGDAPRTPATPSVVEGFSSSPSSRASQSRSTMAPTIR